MTARTLVEPLLRRLRSGTLIVEESGRRRSYGFGEPRALVRVHSARAWRELLRGSIGLADAHADGLWDSPDLVSVVRLLARNAGASDRLRGRLRPLVLPAETVRAWANRSTRARRRRDIAAHYDLGEQLFTRMLDPTMTYSCAVFEQPDTSLEQAQLAKLELLCERLQLDAGDRVLEVGSGWGSFAVHAASTRGCRVTTTTISADQYAYVTGLVKRLGLSDRITVLCQDYRDLRGRYDKLVSIEMIEAVGWRHTGDLLAACSTLLERDGAMLLQAITIDDRLYEIEKASRSFINQRIFPGGALPSIESLSRDVARRTDLQIASLNDITRHYPTTLRHWRERVTADVSTLAELGYDERFMRLWTLYLAYCEAGFAERRIGDVQLLLVKPGSQLPKSGAAGVSMPVEGLATGGSVRTLR
ncbi:MAG TPA: cyclopropane-fatty-acyl-phospholipid synthase family protein [Solirubrobacteraceae bacterium]|nr:cyclopropane-fatty-acyl-phospholipid synthase family protein [Solirubrobacteraceae bacterium]